MTTSLMIDFVLLCLLLATIVYAARLSLQLRNLRDSKSDLDKVVRQLVQATANAHAAMQGLRLSAQEQGSDLQDVIDKTLSVRDEMQLLLEAGERQATKLDKLLDAVRPFTANKVDIQIPATAAPAKAQPVTSPVAVKTTAKPVQKFAIRDPEIERGIDPKIESVTVAREDMEGLSAAERDLLRALGKSRKG